MAIFDPGNGDFIAVDGQIVERDALRIAEKLAEHDPNLRIMCLDPMQSDINDAPFVVCCVRDNGTMYRVFEAWELDDRLVERVMQSDSNRTNIFDKHTSILEVQKKLREDRYKDKALEMQDIVASAVRNRTSAFKFKNDKDELVTIHENKPLEKGYGRIYSHS